MSFPALQIQFKIKFNCSALNLYLIHKRYVTVAVSGAEGWTARTMDGEEIPVEFSDDQGIIYVRPYAAENGAFLVAPGTIHSSSLILIFYNRLGSLEIFVMNITNTKRTAK